MAPAWRTLPCRNEAPRPRRPPQKASTSMAKTGISRRAFLGSTAAVAAASALPSWDAPAVAGGKGPLKLGLASYSMRKFTLDQTLDLLREIGIGYVNFKDFHMPR